MRKFDYRAPRYSVDLQVRMTLDESIYVGRCTEISTEGMKLELDQQLEPGSSGMVQFSHRGINAHLPVRISYSGPNYAGMKFLYDSDEQRKDMIRIVSLCASPRLRFAHLAVR